MGKYDSYNMKVTNNGNVTVTFNDMSQAVTTNMASLACIALHEVGKYLTRVMKLGLLQYRPELRGTKAIKSSFQYWQRKQEVDLQIGTGNLSKSPSNGENWYGYRQELGTPGIVTADHISQKAVPRWGIITDTVDGNADIIQRIEEQYLSRLSNDDPMAGLEDSLEGYVSSPDED